MNATMDVGVLFRETADHGVDDRLRFLGGRGIVEIHQRFAVHAFLQDGEVLPDTPDIEYGPWPRHRGHAAHGASWGNCAASVASSSARNAGILIR